MVRYLITGALLAVMLIASFIIGMKFSSSVEILPNSDCGYSWHIDSASGSTTIPVVILIDQCNKLVHWVFVGNYGVKNVETIDFTGKTREELANEIATEQKRKEQEKADDPLSFLDEN